MAADDMPTHLDKQRTCREGCQVPAEYQIKGACLAIRLGGGGRARQLPGGGGSGQQAC